MPSLDTTQDRLSGMMQSTESAESATNTTNQQSVAAASLPGELMYYIENTETADYPQITSLAEPDVTSAALVNTLVIYNTKYNNLCSSSSITNTSREYYEHDDYTVYGSSNTCNPDRTIEIDALEADDIIMSKNTQAPEVWEALTSETSRGSKSLNESIVNTAIPQQIEHELPTKPLTMIYNEVNNTAITPQKNLDNIPFIPTTHTTTTGIN